MMSSEITSTSVANLFAEHTARSIASASANTGEGSLGTWPTAGDHACAVLGIDVNPNSTFKLKGNTEIAATQIQFRYRTSAILPGFKEPLDWKGAPFILPKDDTQIVDEGNKIRARIELERLKGHLRTITGTDCVDIRAGLLAASTTVTAARVEVVVRCDYRENAGKTYKTEYLTRNLSAA